jgi:hypothetical protein
MKVTSLTTLGLRLLALWDRQPELDLIAADVQANAHHARLVLFLAERVQHASDLSFLTSDSSELEEVEAALCDACYAVELGQSVELKAQNSGVRLALALIFEAIQQQKFMPLARS